MKKSIKTRIRKNDQVCVIAGKSKGTVGRVLAIKGDRVVVEGAAMIKKHVKANPNEGVAGGIIDQPGTIHISNVNHLDAQTQKASRVGVRRHEDGKKVLFTKKSGEEIN